MEATPETNPQTARTSHIAGASNENAAANSSRLSPGELLSRTSAADDLPFRELVQTLPAAIYTCDLDGRLTYFNDAAVALWGCRPEAGDLWCGSWRIFEPDGTPLAPADCPMAVAIREHRIEHGREILIERPDGGRSSVLPHPHLLRDAANVVTGAVNVLLDITARKDAERELAESRARLAEVVDSTRDGIISKSLDGVVTSWNPAAELLFGFTPLEIVGQPISLIVPDGHRHEEAEIIDCLKRGEHLHHFETVRQRKDGRHIDVSLTISPIHEAHGRIVGVVEIARDITERKRSEDQLRKQARLLDLTTDAIIVTDFNTGKITFWNAGAERMHGWTAAEAIGAGTADLLLHEPAEEGRILKELAENGDWSGELAERTKDGREIIVNSRITLVRTEKGEPDSILAIHSDVTERKSLEAQFLRAQRLESVGTLAGGVAHDLNNILTPIVMAIPLLEGEMTPEMKQKIVYTIKENARRGTEIVRQVLLFARGEAGRRVTVHCDNLIGEIMTFARETFPKTISFSATCEPELWTVLGDPTQIEQVLLNLAINARDAMPKGGTLHISAENFMVDESFASMMPGSKAGPHVMLKVSDSGAGIPKEIIDKIFDPFFTTKEVGAGTGLGLSSALGILKSHRGFISVESEPEQGTTFKVLLPAARLEGEATGKKTGLAAPAGNGETILLVDDETNIRVVAEMILEQAGYHVLLAADGANAIVLYAQHRAEIKAVITDAVMPFLDGAALVQVLRNINPEVRIIGTSGTSDQSRAGDLEALCLQNFLRKPFAREDLLSTLHRVLHAEAT